MLACRIHGVRDLRLSEEQEPKPKAGEALLRVTAVGICGSDLHWFEDGGTGTATIKRPLILGHEFAGRLEDGRLVIAEPAIHCGTCELCHEGKYNLCEHNRFAGHGDLDGALQERLAWPVANLTPVPEGITDAEAPLLEPLGVAMHCVDLLHVRAASTVAVLGCGPIGLLIVQVLRAVGTTRILATERADRPHRMAAGRAAGAEVFPADEGCAEALLDATGGRGLDGVIEISGDGAAVEVAMRAARPGSRVVLAGIPADDRTSFRASEARRKGLTLAMARRMPPIYDRAIRLVESGAVKFSGLVTHRFPLRECMRAFGVAAAREGIKVVVEPSLAD